MSIKQIDGYIVFLNKVLGHGSFGNVYKGIIEETNEEVAIKMIPKERIDSKQYLKASLNNEIKILQSVKSQNIVSFYNVAQSSSNYYIVQELCDSDLSQMLKPGQKMPEDQCIQILTQLCNGFLALVREGIIHRDLKPANIMIKGNTYKIGDFGFSKQFNQMKNQQQPESNALDLKMNTTVGTPLYMSLQILKSKEYTSKCDIWALGFIFYEMLHGETPWRGNRQYELGLNIQKIPLKIKRTDLSPETISFLQGCLKPYEKDRFSWNQVFVHPIFKNKFYTMASNNNEYENQMKAIMTKLRFYFNLNKASIQNYLSKYGFMNNNEDLNFEQYFDFLKAVDKSITESEALYIFNKTDKDNSGAISIDQIVEMLKHYGFQINLKTKTRQILQKFFIKLHRVIERSSLSLKKVFRDFDRNKIGKLGFSQFNEMVKTISNNAISEDEAKLAFNSIDEDGSNTLQFSELDKYYKHINKLQS